jgi:RNase P subunit RPR2
MQKKTEELLDDAKKTVSAAVDAAKPVVSKAKKAAAPTVKKVKAAAKPAAEKASDAAHSVKETAKKVTPKKTEFYVQFAGRELDMEELAAKAKATFKEEHKRTAILSCRIYLKPEDNAAYYVVNDTYFGRIDV